MLPLLVIACVCITEPSKPIRLTPAVGQQNAEKQTLERETEVPTESAAPSLLKNSVYLSLCFALGLSFLGLFIPFFYISSYSALHGASPRLAFYMISIANAASLLGRILPGLLADRFGHYNAMVLAILLSALVAFCWTAVVNLAGLIVWCMAYGFCSGVSF